MISLILVIFLSGFSHRGSWVLDFFGYFFKMNNDHPIAVLSLQLAELKMPQYVGWIILYLTDIFVRYKAEWDPKRPANTKGGYLEGEIRVPKVGQPHEKVE